MVKEYIVTNFAYGTGPYLRTTELAIAFNDELELRGRERLGIIVPLVYGDIQKKRMLEEFSDYQDEIFLDEDLGNILKKIFYGNNTYEEALSTWILNAKELSEKAKKHLSAKFFTVSLGGINKEIDGGDIVLEINRSPRIRYDVAPSYFTTFCYVAEILNKLREEDVDFVKQDLLEVGAELADWVEADHKIHAVAYPATFSWQEDYKPRYKSEILTPPISRIYQKNEKDISLGIFVTITGIPGLDRLFGEAQRLGLKLYSNETDIVTGSINALPEMIPNKNIILQFARAGWSSIWLSMISGTPLLVPTFDYKDDPEIYFNNRAIEGLGIGIIYNGQTLDTVLATTETIKQNSQLVCDKIIKRCGMLDGNRYCAKIFVDDFCRLK